MGNATLSFRFTSSTGKGRKARVNAKERSVSPRAILGDPERSWEVHYDPEWCWAVVDDASAALFATKGKYRR